MQFCEVKPDRVLRHSRAPVDYDYHATECSGDGRWRWSHGNANVLNASALCTSKWQMSTLHVFYHHRKKNADFFFFLSYEPFTVLVTVRETKNV